MLFYRWRVNNTIFCVSWIKATLDELRSLDDVSTNVPQFTNTEHYNSAHNNSPVLHKYN